jgi:Ca2+-binding EF-hand superfamily protein
MLSDDDFKLVWQHFDPNRSGEVNYGEFVWSFFNKKKLADRWNDVQKRGRASEAELKMAFFKLDEQGNGRLARKQFMKALERCGMYLDGVEVDALMRRFDIDGDGYIDYNEFAVFMRMQEEEHAREKEGGGASSGADGGGATAMGALMKGDASSGANVSMGGEKGGPRTVKGGGFPVHRAKTAKKVKKVTRRPHSARQASTISSQRTRSENNVSPLNTGRRNGGAAGCGAAGTANGILRNVMGEGATKSMPEQILELRKMLMQQRSEILELSSEP